MYHTLIGAILALLVPGVALWWLPEAHWDFGDATDSVEAVARLVAALLAASFLATLIYVGLRLMARGMW